MGHRKFGEDSMYLEGDPCVVEEFKFMAGPHGRRIAARMKSYRRKVFILSSVIFSLMVIIGGLVTIIIRGV